MTISMQHMLESGVHFGHQTRYWHPKMKPYIFGIRHKIHIINLDKTLPLLQDALNFIGSLAAKKGKILFVGTKMSAQEIIRAEAERCGMPYVSCRWLGGMLTNYKTIRQSIKRLKELEELRDSPTHAGLTKKEALLLRREIDKLEKNLGGVRNMGGLPDAIFIVDIGHEKIAISEAKKLKIPVIGVVDTNCDPSGIDYLIPGNDDAVKAIRFYAQTVADTIATARQHIVEEATLEEKDVKKLVKKGFKPKKTVMTKGADEEAVASVEENADEVVEQDQNEVQEEDAAKPEMPKQKTVKVVKESVDVAKKKIAVKKGAEKKSNTKTTTSIKSKNKSK